MRIIIFNFMLIMSLNLSAQKIDTVNLKELFRGFDGAFCVYSLNSNTYKQFNAEQCKQRFSPCSTYKIANSLIGLETGVIPDTSFVIHPDENLHPRDSFLLSRAPTKYWYQDLSLKNAFKYSSVWYYQELARRVGEQKTEKMVKKLNYGNKDISSAIDSYWLCGSMQISVNEQVEFLRKFYLHELKGFSDKNLDAVKSIMLYETTPDYRLYGKTGSGDCFEDKAIGWYVGFVETASDTYIFAMNVLVSNLNDLNKNYRIEVTKKILRKLEII